MNYTPEGCHDNLQSKYEEYKKYPRILTSYRIRITLLLSKRTTVVNTSFPYYLSLLPSIPYSQNGPSIKSIFVQFSPPQRKRKYNKIKGLGVEIKTILFKNGKRERKTRKRRSKSKRVTTFPTCHQQLMFSHALRSRASLLLFRRTDALITRAFPSPSHSSDIIARCDITQYGILLWSV